MKRIRIGDLVSTNLRADFASAHTLDLEDNPLGEGAFGAVYRVKALNGKPLHGQIAKVLTNKINDADQKGLMTIRALQQSEQDLVREAIENFLDTCPRRAHALGASGWLDQHIGAAALLEPWGD